MPENSLLVLAGLLVIASAAASSVRIMRISLLAAGVVGLSHFALVDSSAIGIGLSMLLILVGGLRLLLARHRRRSGSVLDHERELFEQVMQIEDPANQRRLRDVFRWQDVNAKELLMQQGEMAPPLIYIARGSASIMHDGELVGTCGAGDFLGEMSVISGDEASATVAAVETMRVAKFDRAALGDMVRHVPELGRAIDGALNRSLASKLLRMNKVASTASTDE